MRGQWLSPDRYWRTNGGGRQISMSQSLSYGDFSSNRPMYFGRSLGSDQDFLPSEHSLGVGRGGPDSIRRYPLCSPIFLLPNLK